MNEHMLNLRRILIGMLKSVGMNKEDTLGIMSFMKTEEMMNSLMDKLEEMYPNITPKEAMQVACEIIIKRL